jgi:CDP-glucose 4,6-dehydratase
VESVEVTPSFWQGKRVFVTGHTGFKGSWLSLWLQWLGAEVVGFALPPPTDPNLFELARVGAGMASVIGDIRDCSVLSAELAKHRPEIVFHLAAQPLVRLSYEQPIETYATNVMGTVHLLEAIRRAGTVRAVVNVTSDKCYLNREWQWGYRENEPMGGNDPYSSSKGCAELVTSAYRDSFFGKSDGRSGTALASARAGNVIGGGDWAADRLIPDIMRAFIAGNRAVVRNPRAIRPWQHVLESLSGYLTLAENLWHGGAAFAEAWNFGPDDSDARPVLWVMERIAAAWERADAWTVQEQQSHHEATYLKLDSSKARARLGWRPRWPLERGLRAVNDWYMAYQSGRDVALITLDQIKQYDDTRS